MVSRQEREQEALTALQTRNPSAWVVFHLGTTSGPAIALEPCVGWLQREYGQLEIIAPTHGDGITRRYGTSASVSLLDYTAATFPGGAFGLARTMARLLRDARMFRHQLRRAKPGVVIVVTTMLPAVLVAAKLEGVRSVVYAAELFEKDDVGLARSALSRVLVRITHRLADGVVCCSAGVKRQFGPEGGKPIAVSYPPVDPSNYRNGDGDAFRARHRIMDADPCVLVVGSITHGRGQDVALRAFTKVRKQLPAARLVFVGEPHPRQVDRRFESELRTIARELGTGGGVIFSGFVDRIADAYAAADVVVNPARVSEAFGRVAVEALAAGKPVVSSRVGAVGEILSDEQNSLLVPAGDPDALGRAVLRLVRDRALAERLVEQGRASLGRFSVAQSIKAFGSVTSAVAPSSDGAQSQQRALAPGDA